MKTSRFLVC